jgi:hypothetical protein
MMRSGGKVRFTLLGLQSLSLSSLRYLFIALDWKERPEYSELGVGRIIGHNWFYLD